MSRKWRYFGPFEVVVHNTPEDCWVSFLGKVFNITPVISEYRHEKTIKPLLAMAGKDISHWFDESTGDLQYRIHPVTGNHVPYLPHGRIPDVPVEVPDTRWRPELNPWWKNEGLQVGLLTRKVRTIRIINMLIFKEVYLNVCSEDTFNEIAERYTVFCKDTDSYLWKHNDRRITMYKTLDENGIFDERDKFCELGLPAKTYIPSILLYYQSDFKHLSDDTDSEKECEATSLGRSTQISLLSEPTLIHDTDSYGFYLEHEIYPGEYPMDEYPTEPETIVPSSDNLLKPPVLQSQTDQYLQDIETPGEADILDYFKLRVTTKTRSRTEHGVRMSEVVEIRESMVLPEITIEPVVQEEHGVLEEREVQESAIAEEPKVDETKSEEAEPAVEEPKTEEVVSGEPVVQEPAIEETEISEVVVQEEPQPEDNVEQEDNPQTEDITIEENE